jgi:acyl-CoA thioesterase
MEKEVDKETRDLLERDTFASQLGIKLLEVKPGWAKVGLKLEKSHLNFHGMVHGGVIFSLADAAFAAASNSFGSKAVALSVGIDFLSAAVTSDELTAEVNQISRAGKTGYYGMKVLGSKGETIALCRGWAYHTGKPFDLDK